MFRLQQRCCSTPSNGVCIQLYQWPQAVSDLPRMQQCCFIHDFHCTGFQSKHLPTPGWRKCCQLGSQMWEGA